MSLKLNPIQNVLKHLRYVLRAHTSNPEFVISFQGARKEFSSVIESFEGNLSALLAGFRFFEGYLGAENNLEAYLLNQSIYQTESFTTLFGKTKTRTVNIIKPNVPEQLTVFEKCIAFLADKANLDLLKLMIAKVMPFAAQHGGLTITDISRSTHPGYGTNLFDKEVNMQTLHPYIDAVNNFQHSVTADNTLELFKASNNLIIAHKNTLVQVAFKAISSLIGIDFVVEIEEQIVALLFRIHYQITSNYNQILELGFSQKNINSELRKLLKFALENNIIDFGTYLNDPLPGLSTANQPLAKMAISTEKLSTLDTQLTALWPELLNSSNLLVAQVHTLMQGSAISNNKLRM